MIRDDTAGEPAGVTLPADGTTVWRVTSRDGGHRWLRLRKGGTGYPLPARWTATHCPWDEPSLAGKPRELRWLWRMVEAAPGWGWWLRPVTVDGRVAGWELVIERPDGAEFCFTWLGNELVTTRETIRDIAGQLTADFDGAACLPEPQHQPTPTEGAPPMTKITLEEAWERAAEHAQTARDELQGAQADAAEGRIEYDRFLIDQAQWRLDVSCAHAAAGQAYATMAAAAAAGLASETADVRQRWHHLASDNPKNI